MIEEFASAIDGRRVRDVVEVERHDAALPKWLL
jgi:hypothetical protein